jgi:hypothetical protein
LDSMTLKSEKTVFQNAMPGKANGIMVRRVRPDHDLAQ